MPPKAKAKARGRAKARPKARPRAMAKAGVGGRRLGVRRPAGRGEEPARSPQDRWRAGEEIPGAEVPIELVGTGTKIVITHGKYFHKDCQVAGEVDSLSLRDQEVLMAMRLTGTDDEGILKQHSGNPQGVFRVHKCTNQCAQEETSEDLIHCLKMRRYFKETSLDAKEKKDKKATKKEKKKKKKTERRKAKSEKGSSEESREEDLLNGSRPKAAGRKDPSVIFSGTGLDPRDRVRKRVVRKARNHLKKKGTKDHSSDSDETSTLGTDSDMDMEDESVFQQASKIRVVANGYPGALGCQALTQMRGFLLSEVGNEDKPGVLKGCAVAYFRQCLQRKSNGPSQRELLTIASAVDLMVAGRVAAAVDLLLQRFKSCESTLNGSHWSVSQRQEILPQEGKWRVPAEMSTRRAGYAGWQDNPTAVGPADRERLVEAKERQRRAPKVEKGSKRRKEGEPPKRREPPSGKGGASAESLRRGETQKAEEDAREGTLEQVMREVDKWMEEGYKGGKEVAPRLESDDVDLPGGSKLEEMPPVRQSMHEATTKLAAAEFGQSLQENPGTTGKSDCLAFKTTADAFESESKKDASFALQGLQLGQCGSVLVQRLLEVLPLCSQTTGKGDSHSLFPLPTSRSSFLALFPDLIPQELVWLECLCLSLNSCWGGPIQTSAKISKVQQKCLQGLVKDVRRFCAIQAKVETFDWKDFFKIRSVDYKGEEVKVARKFSWDNIAPALPREVGKVPLAEMCICTFIEESEVFHVKGEPLLNGMFGVTKEEWTDSGWEILRLIMNLVPLNSLCLPMNGDVHTLPSWGGMSPFFLQPTQNLLVTSEDVKCFFYTMSVPSTWVKYLAFNKPVPQAVLPGHLQGKLVYLASLVLPMGFLNSVSLAQHVHRNLVLASGGGQVNAPEAELRKDRSFTSSSTPWRVYLDNYDLLEKVEATQMTQVEGSQAPGVMALRQEYEKWEVPRNVKKAVQRSAKAELQGAIVDGVAGVAYPKDSKLAKYLGMAWALASQKWASQKQWQAGHAPDCLLYVLTIGLFDGLGALRVCHDVLQVHVLGHVSVEKSAAARRVVEAHYPGTIVLDDVATVTPDVVKEWSTLFSQCSLVLLGAGPPCQGVSGLNADRKGALKDERSCLFSHVPRIRELVRQHFRWCPVYTIMESVASMDATDRATMTEAFGEDPYACNAGSMTWCHRPRLYWLDWEVKPGVGAEVIAACGSEPAQVVLTALQPIEQVANQLGWDNALWRRSSVGKKICIVSPLYQYREVHCLVNSRNSLRVPDVSERELMLGFPLHYTAACGTKSERKSVAYTDQRLSLLGNTWSVAVVSWLLGQLYSQLGLCAPMTPQAVVNRLLPGADELMQGRLVRLPLNPAPGAAEAPMYDLAFKLGNLISMKGEDIMLSTPTSQMPRHHRLRSSVPSKLWKWKVIAGWQWTKGQEHINALELRAIMTSLRWRIEHCLQVDTRWVHLTDSLVCLHCLSRGRSSSKKLRRTLSRINAMILASNVQPVWGYIHTDIPPISPRAGGGG
eukprot:s581_g26.t1